jgi:GTP-binding protein EngB required for normal cell division
MRERDHSGVKGKPLIVFAGRSNVGKSSIIRALTGRKLRVGKKPGSTRWEQFIDLGPIVLVDIPGFGYMAGQSKTAIDEMKTHIIHRLENWSERAILSVLIIDVSLFGQLVERWDQRGEIPVDVEFYTFLSEITPHVIVVANKIDKIKPREQERAITYLKNTLKASITRKEMTIVVTAASKKVGISELKDAINQTLSREEIQKPDW